jgi:tetratricopeptide (TPR) repeat protein
VRVFVAAILLAIVAACLPSQLVGQQETDAKAQARQLLLEAAQLIKDIPEIQQPGAAANIADQLVRAGDLPDALATARLLKKPDQQAFALRVVAWQLAHSGNFAQAVALVEADVNGEEKLMGYDALANFLAGKGDRDGALDIAHRISKNPYLLRETLLGVARQLSKAGDSTGARQALSEALDIIDEGMKENLDSWALELPKIATAQAEIGDTSGALTTLDQLSEIAHRDKINKFDAAMLLQQLAATQGQLGDLVGARRTIEEIPPGNSVMADGCWMSISWQQAERGLMVDALESVARISSPSLQTSTLREMAKIRGTHGTLNDALEAIDDIPDPAVRVKAVVAVALEQATNHNPAASSTLQTAWVLVRDEGIAASDDERGTIAIARAHLGDFPGAQQIVQDMANPESRVWPLYEISCTLALAGRFSEAAAYAENENAAHPKTFALLGAADGILSHLEAEQQARDKKQ